MGYLDDYKTRVRAYATSPLNSLVKTTERFVNDSFTSSPSYRQGTLNGSPIDFLFITGNSNKNLYGEKDFVFRPNSVIERGDLIGLNADTWISLDTNHGNNVTPKATVFLCNDSLKWKDRNGTIFSHPCAAIPYRGIRAIANDTFSMNLPQGHMFVAVQINSETQKIVPMQRFFLGSQVYEITGIDDSSYSYNGKGLMYFTVGVTTKDNFNDDFVNRVADNSFLFKGSTPTPSSVPTTGNNTTSQTGGGVKAWD